MSESNGTQTRAFIDESVHFLNQHQVMAYYQSALPVGIDERLGEMVQAFVAATAEQRRLFLQQLTHQHRSLFGIYSHRAATLAVRQEAPDLLRQGMIASVIANDVIPERRRVEVAWALFHHCARKLAMNPVDLFEETAVYAKPDLATQMIAFSKQGVNLRSYGWRELKTPDGIQYKFDW